MFRKLNETQTQKIRNYDKKNKPYYAIILCFSNIMFSQNLNDLVGFIQGIIILDKNKKMHLFRCSFVRLFRKNFLMMEKQSFEKKNLSHLSI